LDLKPRAGADSKRRPTRFAPLTWILVYLVLAGGIYPALYENQLPHVHVFVGGPPPPDWENHLHENPLNVLFGSAAETGLTAGGDPPASTKAGRPKTFGRVVSIYPGVPRVILSLVTVTVLGMALGTLAPPGLTSRIGRWLPTRPAVLIEGPTPPPPRLV